MNTEPEQDYRVIIERPAWSQLVKLDEKTQDKINDVIYALAHEPRPSGCKKLKGAQLSYRVRIGNFRVLYDIHDDVLVVLVVQVIDRKAGYD